MSTEVAKAWEGACLEGELPGVRRVLMRSAMVMSPDKGGIFDTLLGLVRRGLGGNAAGGRQFVSWIHDADFIRAVDWLIERGDVSGPVNLAAPGALPYADFMRALRRAAGVRIGLPATRLMLEAGACLMGTETELVLKSRRVAPGRLREGGFVFGFPQWADAAEDLVARRAGAP
jgi:NAD dependent epimerase/dehydratase family enzyme